MERGMNSCSWFSVSDYESSSSNTDFLRWIKSSGAAPEAAHHQQTIPFLPVGGGGSSIYLDQVTSCYGGGGENRRSLSVAICGLIDVIFRDF